MPRMSNIFSFSKHFDPSASEEIIACRYDPRKIDGIMTQAIIQQVIDGIAEQVIKEYMESHKKDLSRYISAEKIMDRVNEKIAQKLMKPLEG